MSRDERFEEQLAEALDTRPVIEQAKGVLVAVRRATPEQAFEELRHVSQTHNLKLNELAAGLVRVAAGRVLEDLGLGRVIWQEWADVLPEAAAGISGTAESA